MFSQKVYVFQVAGRLVLMEENKEFILEKNVDND
jgi:hypothetical protein